MKKIIFITFYNDFSVGVNILSTLLIQAGYDVSVIFFKIPSIGQVDWFSDHNTEFMEAVDSYGNVIGGNATYNRWSEQEIRLLQEQVKNLSPDILCFNSRTMDNELAREVFPKVCSITKAITIAGGFGPSLDPEIYAKLVDYVFVGEAENCIVDLVRHIEKGESLKDYPNICYMKNNKLVRNSLGSPFLSSYTHQVLPKNTYYIENDRVYSDHERGLLASTHTYSTFLGRGCISTCSYCSTGNWRNLYHKEGFTIKPRRNRNIEDVIDELSDVKSSGITFIHFRDEFMTAKSSDLIKFFELYERKINLPFWAYLVPQQILNYPEILKKAVDAGFVDTEIGFQSGSDMINRTVFNRNLPHKYTLQYVKKLSEYHINMKYDFIIFNPAESQADIDATIALIQELPKKRAYLYLPRLFYFPSTPLNNILKGKRVQAEDFEKHYKIALSYLIGFATTPQEYKKIMTDKTITFSWESLKGFYKNYLQENNITFNKGSHTVPDSITAPRYERILKKYMYQDIVIWGEQNYYQQMKGIFKNNNILVYRDEKSAHKKDQDAYLKSLGKEIPIFICSPDKDKVFKTISEKIPEYKGKIYL